MYEHILCYKVNYDSYSQLMFEAKRITNPGSDFALDDIVIPLTDCDASPLYPPSVTSTATGNVPLLYTSLLRVPLQVMYPFYIGSLIGVLPQAVHRLLRNPLK